MTNVFTIIRSHPHESKRFLGFSRGCLAIAATVTLGTGSLLVSESAHAAGFEGDYDPINWTVTNNNADGSVDTTGAPGSISLTGGNNGSSSAGLTSYTTTSQVNGLFNFTWNYLTDDGASIFDPFSVLIGNTAIQLTDNGSFSLNQTGIFSQSVSAGQLIGFQINTTSNTFGSANVTISDFSIVADPVDPAIPTPAMLPGLIGMGIAAWRKKRQQNASKSGFSA